MFDKIDITSIIREHLNTLKSNNTKRYHLPDIILFLVFPLFFSLLLVFFNSLLSKDFANIMAASFSIFAGLLLNLLLILFDLIDKEEKQKK
ncbi:MAG: hypothetical protein HC930_17650 [Hydrococcus sp. SU_1_0]|nr:hypothetical protein [Hydrococcus sp. SU_1_0]